MIITMDTAFDFGDTVAMRNDPDQNAGIVAGYKIMPGQEYVEYLVVWSPTLSSYCYEFEIQKVVVEEKGQFGG